MELDPGRGLALRILPVSARPRSPFEKAPPKPQGPAVRHWEDTGCCRSKKRGKVQFLAANQAALVMGRDSLPAAHVARPARRRDRSAPDAMLRIYALAATRRHALRRGLPLCEKMKSAMRGAISARKREPLNTP